MTRGIRNPWIPCDALQLAGHMGVFELADAAQETLWIGYAGGKSRFGLRGEVEAAIGLVADARWCRVEVTTAYHTRYRELLMLYISQHDRPPPGDPIPGNPKVALGRLSSVN